MDYGSSALNISQRDVILIPFPFSDLTGAKVRPALVISNDLYHATHLDAVVLALTSNLSTSDYKVLIEAQALSTGSLPVLSAVRVDKPFSVLQSKVLKIQAKITSAKFEEIKAVMTKLIE